MTQISRPFQIALAAVVLLSAIWFFALRGHSPSGEGASSASAPASGSSASSSGAAASSSAAGSSQSAPGGATKASQAHVTHGSAPGVEGLTRAIERARGAVKQSEQNAQQLAQKSAQASSSTQAPASASAADAASDRLQKGSATTRPTSVAKPPATRTSTSVQAPKLASVPDQQAAVEAELKQGRTVIVLFWSPRGADDVAVRHQLAILQGAPPRRGAAQGKTIAVHYSSMGEVGQYGTITRSLQVLQTPTMLVIGPSGKTKTLTGLADSFAIQQAIVEARHS